MVVLFPDSNLRELLIQGLEHDYTLKFVIFMMIFRIFQSLFPLSCFDHIPETERGRLCVIKLSPAKNYHSHHLFCFYFLLFQIKSAIRSEKYSYLKSNGSLPHHLLYQHMNHKGHNTDLSLLYETLAG